MKPLNYHEALALLEKIEGRMKMPSEQAVKIAEQYVACDRMKNPTPGCNGLGGIGQHAEKCSVASLARAFDTERASVWEEAAESVLGTTWGVSAESRRGIYSAFRARAALAERGR